MLVLAKDKETNQETVWFSCVNEELLATILASQPEKNRWTFRVVEDQTCFRVEGRDPVWRIKP